MSSFTDSTNQGFVYGYPAGHGEHHAEYGFPVSAPTPTEPIPMGLNSSARGVDPPRHAERRPWGGRPLRELDDCMLKPSKFTCMLAVTVILIVFGMLGILVWVEIEHHYKTTDPKFYIQSVMLSPPLNTPNISTHGSRNWTLGVSVRNPNHYSVIDYRKLAVTVSCQVDPHNYVISETTLIEPFRQESLNSTALTATTAWSPPVADGVLAGGLNISVTLQVEMYIKSKLQRFPNYEAEFLCNGISVSQGRMTPAEPVDCPKISSAFLSQSR